MWCVNDLGKLQQLSVCGQSWKDAFQVFVTPNIVQDVCCFTNLEGTNRHGSQWIVTDEDDIYKFIGILLETGVYHDNKTRVSEL